VIAYGETGFRAAGIFGQECMKHNFLLASVQYMPNYVTEHKVCDDWQRVTSKMERDMTKDDVAARLPS
jgi:hypothetical protein